VPIDAPIAENWGQLAARRSLPVIDGLIASTAMVRGFVLVTRNTRDFEGLGIQVINPWQA
jgi:predicted nucleic acid-binding protein